MLISLFIFGLIISFSIHIYVLVQYVQLKQKKYLTLFLNTAVSNIVIACGLIFTTLYKPELMRIIDYKFLFWILSGITMSIMLFIKISIFRMIYKRSKEPEHFHLNFFGKKVLHATVVKPSYILGFFGTMPFFLIAGAYFVARLVNLILYNEL